VGRLVRMIEAGSVPPLSDQTGTETMARHRQSLPQLSDDRLFLTDGGLETTLIYHDQVDLPAFAAFTLMDSAEGRQRLRAYYERYARIATRSRLGFILESPTWRSNADWGEKLGYAADALADINRRSIELMHGLRRALE